MRFIIPIILLIISGMVFFGYIDPMYNEVKDLSKEEKLFNEALENSRELNSIYSALTEDRNTLSINDEERLKKLMPDNVDNVRLIRDIDGIAGRYDMPMTNVGVDVSGEGTGGDLAANSPQYGTATLNFTVEAPYKTFLAFLKDLERSLRIVDVVSISFVASEVDLYQYNVQVRTYWMR